MPQLLYQWCAKHRSISCSCARNCKNCLVNHLNPKHSVNIARWDLFFVNIYIVDYLILLVFRVNWDLAQFNHGNDIHIQYILSSLPEFRSATTNFGAPCLCCRKQNGKVIWWKVVSGLWSVLSCPTWEAVKWTKLLRRSRPHTFYFTHGPIKV